MENISKVASAQTTRHQQHYWAQKELFVQESLFPAHLNTYVFIMMSSTVQVPRTTRLSRLPLLTPTESLDAEHDLVVQISATLSSLPVTNFDSALHVQNQLVFLY